MGRSVTAGVSRKMNRKEKTMEILINTIAPHLRHRAALAYRDMVASGKSDLDWALWVNRYIEGELV